MTSDNSQPLVPDVAEKMALDYSILDPGIRDAVRALHNAGIETWQSCEGGDGHAFPEPTICLVANGLCVAQNAITALLAAGYYPFRLMQVWTAPDFDDVQHWQITIRGNGIETWPWWTSIARTEQTDWVNRRYVNQIERGEVSSA